MEFEEFMKKVLSERARNLRYVHGYVEVAYIEPIDPRAGLYRVHKDVIKYCLYPEKLKFICRRYVDNRKVWTRWGTVKGSEIARLFSRIREMYARGEKDVYDVLEELVDLVEKKLDIAIIGDIVSYEMNLVSPPAVDVFKHEIEL